MRERAYDLASVWRVPAPRPDCWAVLADPEMTWPRWWPGVQAIAVRATDEAVGSWARLRFRSPLRYALVLDLTVLAADEPARVHVAVAGDLVGTGDVLLSPTAPDATRIDVEWHVRTSRPWMNALGPVLAPAFAATHAATMRQGERGLRTHLARA